MIKELLIVLIIVGIAVILLSVRLFFGKNFVHTHVEGNPALDKRGIGCVKHQDREARAKGDFKVKEHSDSK